MTQSDVAGLARTWAREQALAPNPAQANFMKAVMNNGNNVPPELLAKLENSKRLDYFDGTVIYTFKAKDRTVELFHPESKAQIGVITYSDGKLPDNYVFVPSNLQVLYANITGVAANSPEEKKALAEASYSPIYEKPELMNSTVLSVACDQKQLINEFPLSNFDNRGVFGERAATFNFGNSIVFTPTTQWKGQLKFNENVDVPADTYIKLVFKGAMVVVKPQ